MLDQPLFAPPKETLSRCCPHQPWWKQQLFLSLNCREAFFGGACGGGKSEALLMAALQYVHVPGYAALILRKDTQRLRLAGGLMPRAHEWLTGKAEWNGVEKTWTFATSGAPATLRFGYLQTPDDRHRYMSSEFQFIAFDELTEFHADEYLYLFSRLRRLESMSHVPLRMRAASNPGNIGHAWVKRRFIENAVPERGQGAGDGEQAEQEPSERPSPLLWLEGRAYLPAQIADNPALDAATYRENLAHLPAVERERLMHGDWTVRADGQIRPEWLRDYMLVEGQYELQRAGGGLVGAVAESACRRLVTIDPAGTSADRAREARGRERSWTVMQVWDQPRGALAPHLMLRHQWRGQVNFEALCARLEAIYAEFRPARMHIENEKLGQAAVDLLSRRLPLECVPTGGKDKLARAAPLLLKLERGEIWLPRHDAGFRRDLEAEWLAWTGHPDEPSDQLDAAAYAALLAAHSGSITLQPVVVV